MKLTHVIASQRPWNKNLADGLFSKTGQSFILITTPEELVEERLRQINPAYIFFPHWSTKIPSSIWENYESIIFHMTDLPYGRGGSPLQNLILRGHPSTMLSAIRCVEGFDAGPVYLKQPLSLSGSAQEIFTRTDELIESMIVHILNTRPIPTPQVGEPTIFKRRKPEDSHLGNVQSLNEIYDMIRMLDAEGYPKAFFDVNDFRFEFNHAKYDGDSIQANVTIRPIQKEDIK